jgi:hypothetical protein
VVRAGSQRSREAGNSRAIGSVEAVKGAVPPIHTEMGALERKGAAPQRPYKFPPFAIRYSPFAVFFSTRHSLLAARCSLSAVLHNSPFSIRHSPYSAVHGFLQWSLVVSIFGGATSPVVCAMLRRHAASLRRGATPGVGCF